MNFNKAISFILCFFILYTVTGQVSTENPQAVDCGNNKGGQNLFSVINDQSNTLQSSTHSILNNIGDASKAIDGINTGTFAQGKATRTNSENTPWWEVQFDDIYALESIKLYYPTDVYPNGVSNIYILTSTSPFSSTNLASEISSPLVKSIHVEGTISSGTSIPLDFNSAQYLRVQYNGEGALSLLEVDIPGTNTEICDNGIDDDCDGRIDCEDNDCAPTFINVEKINPSCPICNDGEIKIQYSYKDNSRISVSINGEENLGECVTGGDYDPKCLFEKLPDGEYNLFISNGDCIVEYPNNPVILSSPPGVFTSLCENGGFEEGDFTGWEGRFGTRATGFPNSGLPSDRFEILSSGQDPNVPISYPFLGTYCARFGNDDVESEQESLKYCFEVTEENADFSFYFAVVLEDPDHLDFEQSFFQYSITHLVNGIPTLIPNGEVRIIADLENPLFLTVGEEPAIVYTNWDCSSFDLSSFIGEEVCIEYQVGDCTLGGHYGYCYIDGICASGEDALPNLELNFETNIFCKNQETIIDGSNSNGFNNVKWEVCELTQNNDKINCVTQESISSILGQFNVGDFYSNLGQNFECGKSYSIKLTLGNNCSEPVSEDVVIQYLCEENNFSYKDFLICGSTSIDVTIQGENDCGGECIYDWTPPIPLDNPTLEFPTILGTTNFLAFSQDYIANIENPEGCRYKGEVNIIELNPIEFIIIEDENFCTSTLQAKLTLISPIHSDLVSLTFTNLRTLQEFDGILISESGIRNMFTFELPEDFDNNNPDSYFVQASWDASSLASDNLVILQGNSCFQSTTYTPPIDDTYFGDFIEFGMPNAFTPAGSENTTFGPILVDMLNHNIYRGELKIYNRFGNMVFEKEVFSSPGGASFDMNELHWDGLEDGQLHNLELYLWILDLENCDNPTLQNDNVDCDCTVEEFRDGLCPDCNYKGDVTLVL